MVVWLWVIFAAFVAGLAALDLGVLTRRPRAVTAAEAGVSVALWILTATVFSFMLARLYATNTLGLATGLGHALSPDVAWIQFVGAYATELAMSIDNVAVLAIIFAHFRVPEALRPRVLFYLMVVCLVLRAGLIFGGAELMRWPWTAAVFGVLLLIASVRELWLPDQEAQIGRRILMRVVNRLPTTAAADGQKLITHASGRWAMTPLMTVFVAAVVGDLSFAIDSLPAAFAVTRDPFIAFTANALAILSLRSIYFAVAPYIARFRFMKVSLVAIFLFLAWKVALGRGEWYDHLGTSITLAVIVGTLGFGLLASYAYHRRAGAARAESARPTPLEDLGEAAKLARKNVWKIWILIAGTAVIIAGIAIAPLPGPGPTVLIPMGLVILASEFVWAKKLLKIFTEKSLQLAEQGDKVGASFPKWVLMPIILAYYGFWSIMVIYSPNAGLTLFYNCTCFGLSFPFLAWVIRTAGMDLGPRLNRFIYATRKGPGSRPGSAGTGTGTGNHHRDAEAPSSTELKSG